MMKKMLICLLCLCLTMGVMLPMTLTAGATNTTVTTPLAITEVCFNPTYIEENAYGVSKSADVFEFMEVYNIADTPVSLADAVVRCSNKGYKEDAFMQNQLICISTSQRTLAAGEMAIITFYNSETPKVQLSYGSDADITAYYNAFCEFYQCADEVKIENFYIAPKYQDKSSEEKIEGAFNLGNDTENVVLRVVAGETLLAESNYNANQYNKNGTSLQMLYQGELNVDHPAASITFTNSGATPGVLRENQVKDVVLIPAEGVDTMAVKVMQYNICSSDCTQVNADESAFSMEQRFDGVFATIQAHNADVIGLCEVNYVWHPEINARLTTTEGGYECFGMSSQGKLFSEEPNQGQTWDFYNLILWKTEKYNLIDSGYFWCSASPQRPNSFTWQGGLKGDFARCINWVILEEKTTGSRFFFVCGHIDAKYADVRALSMQLINQKVGELSQGLPVIMVGDWNCADNSEAYSYMVQNGIADARYLVPKSAKMTVRGTFNKWGVNTDISSRLPIDLCFVSAESVYVNSALMDMGYYEDTMLYSSDHHAVVYEMDVLQVIPATEEEETQAPDADTQVPEDETQAEVLGTTPDVDTSAPADTDTNTNTNTNVENQPSVPAETDGDDLVPEPAVPKGCASVSLMSVCLMTLVGCVPAVLMARRQKEE